MKLKKCPEHEYTMEHECSVCKKQTKDAHYKFLNLGDVKNSGMKKTDE